MIVCSCHAVTDREIRRLVRAGTCTLREVAETCGAGSACGGCRASVKAILKQHREAMSPPPQVAGSGVSLAVEPA